MANKAGGASCRGTGLALERSPEDTARPFEKYRLRESGNFYGPMRLLGLKRFTSIHTRSARYFECLTASTSPPRAVQLD
jgi:hypothetical protein